MPGLLRSASEAVETETLLRRATSASVTRLVNGYVPYLKRSGNEVNVMQISLKSNSTCLSLDSAFPQSILPASLGRVPDGGPRSA